MNRRQLITSGGLMLAGLGAPASVRAAVQLAQIAMRSGPDGAKVWFEPALIVVAPGTTVRWTSAENVHTATAYHPGNDNHSLRIPHGAEPFDSGYLVNPGDHFDVTLHVPGTYDYYCAPHEQGGMAGRIIVARPGGPGALAFDYFKHLSPPPAWREVPAAVQKTLGALGS